MRIPLSTLLKIDNIDSFHLEYNRSDQVFVSVFIVGKKGTGEPPPREVTRESLEELQTRGTSEISVITDSLFREELKKVNPELLEEKNATGKISWLLNLARQYEMMNQKSQKRRQLTVLEDICRSDADALSGKKQLVIEYGTRLTAKTVARVQKSVDPVEEADYRDSECGVLVFVPDAENFKLKVDLLAILASLNMEIYDSANIKEGAGLYREKSPKLVVLGNLGGNIKSRALLLELEKYDPFVKKLNYDESPASNRESETERIRNSYTQDYSQILETMNRKKDPLPPAIKNNIMDALSRLEGKYSFKSYVETAYTIKQFGRMFNIATLWNMLENIRKEHQSSA